jgi:hypothetical protein
MLLPLMAPSTGAPQNPAPIRRSAGDAFGAIARIRGYFVLLPGKPVKLQEQKGRKVYRPAGTGSMETAGFRGFRAADGKIRPKTPASVRPGRGGGEPHEGRCSGIRNRPTGPENGLRRSPPADKSIHSRDPAAPGRGLEWRRHSRPVPGSCISRPCSRSAYRSVMPAM